MDWLKLIQFLFTSLPSLLEAIMKMIKAIKGQSFADAPLDAEAALDELIAACHADKARLVAAKVPA